MDYDKLIDDLRVACAGNQYNIMGVAATALSTLQAENEEMQKHLNEFSEFLCHMTGGLLSKTNYTAQEMISAAEDYQQNVCGECDLRAENEKLRVGLEQVKRERDAAVKAVERVRSCKDCGHYTGEWTPPCKECQDSEEHHPYFKWRGPQKED